MSNQLSKDFKKSDLKYKGVPVVPGSLEKASK